MGLPPAAGALWAKAAGINAFILSPVWEGAPGTRACTQDSERAALCHSVRRGPPRQIGGGEGGRTALRDGPPQRSHQAQVEGEVVNGVQAAAQDLVAAVEMPQIGPRVVAAGIAVAFPVDWT